MKLSICMMVKDEENNLRRCLEKLKPIVDVGLAELIIVDTGSNDNTLSIAKEYTNNVYFHKWNKNFSEMRNKSISYAKGEWIFIIDADERLDDVEKLITLLKSDELENYNTVLLQVKNLYDYKDEDRYNLILSPRVFRNDGEFKYVGAVHNQPMSKEPNLSVDISLTHFGYISTDKELMEKKYKRTVELLKNELSNDPENLYYLYQLGISYDMHSDHKESLEQFRKAYKILTEKKLLRERTYVYILASYSRISYTNGKLKEALKIAKQVIKIQADYIDMYYIIGLVEKQLGNIEESFKYFNKYLDVSRRYYNSEISKDLTIIMYHMDKDSISNGYFEIYNHYIKNKNYKEAYRNYKNITIINQKIYSGINILLELKKYDELKELYLSLVDKENKDIFLSTLETEIDKLEVEDKRKIYKEFSSEDDIYGLLNNLRLSDNISEKTKLSTMLLQNIDFNKELIFYSQVFKYLKGDLKQIIDSFTKIEMFSLKKIIQYIIEKDKEFITEFENCVLSCEEDLLELNELKVYISTIYVLLLLNVRDNLTIDKKYQDIFKKYLKLGIKFVSTIYQANKAELIYKNVNNVEDRFFLIMYIIENKIKSEEKKLAINYMIEALNTYEAMAKYIDVYKNDILIKESNVSPQQQEFQKYKIQIKENINTLINDEQLEQAKLLLNEYKTIVPNDIEIYAINAVISIMEGNLIQAENILNEGLEKEPYNQELLLNMSYLMDQNKKESKAVECFSKAKIFTSNNDIKVNDFISHRIPIDNNNLRIIQGTMEIANQMNTINKGLKNLGADAKTLNYYPNYIKCKSDYEIDINSFKDMEEADIETKKLASNIIANNDVFHFHFGTSLTLDYSDLPLLKELGKKVVMQYWGSDVRMYSKALKMNPYVKVKDMNEDGIRRKLEFISKYIPNCIVDYELAEYVNDYHNNIHYTRVGIDLNKFKLIKETNNKKLLIVHAPTSPEIKGTSYILKAIEELKDKYDFEFKLVTGMSHKEAIKIYKKADLIIDQILIGSHGVFAVESMAMGKPIICFISDFMKEKYPKELPVISANPDNIKEKIEYAIKNKDMLKELGIKGRAYAEKYHDMNKIANNIMEIYKKL